MAVTISAERILLVLIVLVANLVELRFIGGMVQSKLLHPCSKHHSLLVGFSARDIFVAAIVGGGILADGAPFFRSATRTPVGANHLEQHFCSDQSVRAWRINRGRQPVQLTRRKKIANLLSRTCHLGRSCACCL